jgi:hypothetical protein
MLLLFRILAARSVRYRKLLLLVVSASVLMLAGGVVVLSSVTDSAAPPIKGGLFAGEDKLADAHDFPIEARNKNHLSGPGEMNSGSYWRLGSSTSPAKTAWSTWYIEGRNNTSCD